MPSLRMKTDSSSLKEKGYLGLCKKSSMISKDSCSRVSVSQQHAEIGKSRMICQDDCVLASVEMQAQNVEADESIDKQVFSNEEEPLPIRDTKDLEAMELADNCLPDTETIFSPALELAELHGVCNADDDSVADSLAVKDKNIEGILNYRRKVDSVARGSSGDPNVPKIGAEESDDNRSSYDYQTSYISDFFISDMIFAGSPFDESLVFDGLDFLPDYRWVEPRMLIDVAEECVVLPLLEDTVKVSNSCDMKSCEEKVEENEKNSLYTAISQITSPKEEHNFDTDSWQSEGFDPQSFIRSQPELSDVVSNFQPSIFPKESQRTKPITLVLDLDETLVHSTLEHCDDADFTFTVFFNMKEHIVYVKKRPYLHTFLERVAEMFEVVIFTASQSIYAEQLLDRLDPEGNLFTRRAYRESCIFFDGGYTKDLTVLGVDLAKIAIIDNSPQVFRLQVNNGIPIKSWFSDLSDCALMSLLPFLETLAVAEDVRPLIAQRFGNKE